MPMDAAKRLAELLKHGTDTPGQKPAHRRSHTASSNTLRNGELLMRRCMIKASPWVYVLPTHLGAVWDLAERNGNASAILWVSAQAAAVLGQSCAKGVVGCD